MRSSSRLKSIAASFLLTAIACGHATAAERICERFPLSELDDCFVRVLDQHPPVNRLASEDLEDAYPDWQKIVGAVDTRKGEKPDPNNAFRKWLATKDKAYQDLINGTNSAGVIIGAIRAFQSETKPALSAPAKPAQVKNNEGVDLSNPQAIEDDNTCRSYGAKRGTDAYVKCRQDRASTRELLAARQAEQAQAAADAERLQQARLLAERQADLARQRAAAAAQAQSAAQANANALANCRAQSNNSPALANAAKNPFFAAAMQEQYVQDCMRAAGWP